MAVEHDEVLIAVPSGTFNHLARDLGLDGPEDTIAAIRAGTAIHMDLGCVTPADGGDTRTFVNTLSFGGYTQVVDARERLQPRIGKWAALAVALGARAAADGAAATSRSTASRPRCGWAGSATAPTPPPASPRRGANGSTTGCSMCASCSAIAASPAPASSPRCWSVGCAAAPCTASSASASWRSCRPTGPLRLAVDGETFDGAARFAVTKRRRALAVAVPPS